mmetsp:Transcript_20169/g.32525  ORF Transcript_20169/g.32525 Transcript_20169/m.32525 type:complete len:308 (-) Transcript_20169:162-1085(-)|eukprot:CAMPEP_0178756890 /NCGR_PEP_ID=MMETSP0744-20121128/13529_1 /TAXON_ID=913974 /ORGANISM="Nitzschia punctata, Strain CCMP561" /LENGTH=307 /DNA_ID=CAMNT_0020411089 /DNA_START=4 /DNA_END=927 /DNA_ORIENTATION=-
MNGYTKCFLYLLLAQGTLSFSPVANRLHVPSTATTSFSSMKPLHAEFGSAPSENDSREEEGGCPLECDSSNQDYAKLADEFAESIDISREAARMDSFDSYITVSVLTATASFNCLQGLNLPAGADFGCVILYNLTSLIATACCLAGIYSTVVFSFSSIYGRTAVGLGRDTVYEEFLAKTGDLRRKGFEAYGFSLILLLSEILLVSAEHLDNHLLWPVLLVGSCFATLFMGDWKQMVELAGPIFSPAPLSEEEERSNRKVRKNQRKSERQFKFDGQDFTFKSEMPIVQKAVVAAAPVWKMLFTNEKMV